jgi:4-hydroxy-2-oxoheptanedioate aldolase
MAAGRRPACVDWFAMLRHNLARSSSLRSNTLKQKLRSGEATFGTWLTLGDLCATRVLARMGFDWLTLDMEHGAIDWSTAATLFAAVADAGCVPLARVPEGSHHYIKRVLDAGAWGIVVPMVNTAEEARRAIAAAKYPPQGNRSAGGGMHALNFDMSTAQYYEQANDQIVVVLQTESPLGVENAEEIYRLPGCDAVFVGPLDLKFQMRAADGQFPTAEAHEAMVQRVIECGQRVGTPTGMHTLDVQTALLRREQGMQLIAVGTDLSLMTAQAQHVMAQLRP